MDSNESALLRERSLAPLYTFLVSRACGVFGLQIFACVLIFKMVNLGVGPMGLSQLGLVGALSSLGFAFPIGHAVDCLPRRSAILISHGLVVFCGFFFSVLNPAQFSGLLVGAAALAFTRNFRSISQFAVFGELLARVEKKEKWINLSTLAWQISAVTAPLLAGLLGAGRVSFICGTVFVSAGLLCQFYIVTFLKGAPVKENEAPTEATAEITEKFEIRLFEFLRANFKVRSSLLLDFFVVLFAGASSLLPFLHLDHQSAFDIGLIRSSLPAGILFGTVFRLHKNATVGWAQKLLLATLGYGLCHVALASSPFFPLSYALLFGAGIFDALSISIRECLLQLETPAAIKGRVYALNNFFVNASDELSEWESGLAATAIGVRSAIRVSGAAAIFASGAFALKVKNRKNFEHSVVQGATHESRGRVLARN